MPKLTITLENIQQHLTISDMRKILEFLNNLDSGIRSSALKSIAELVKYSMLQQLCDMLRLTTLSENIQQHLMESDIQKILGLLGDQDSYVHSSAHETLAEFVKFSMF